MSQLAEKVARPPWFKFFPSDWRADPALRMCSIAARGLWMEMLCVMHEAEPRGTLRVNGRSVSDRQLAGLAGLSLKEVVCLVQELEEAGVFSREDSGTIYSRRMRRDDEKAERDKTNGKGGGNPNLKGGVNPKDKAHGTRTPATQRPEARVTVPDGTSGEAPPPEPVDPVERLWALGLPALSAMGLSDRQARPLIGRWLRDHRSDAGRVLAAIQRAREHGTKDPAALVGRLLSPTSRPERHDRGKALNDAFADLGDRLREAEAGPSRGLLAIRGG